MKRPSVKRLFRFPTRSRHELATDARDEAQFHVDMRAEDLRHRGLTEADARAQALREFGDLRSSIEAGVRHETAPRTAPGGVAHVGRSPAGHQARGAAAGAERQVRRRQRS